MILILNHSFFFTFIQKLLLSLQVDCRWGNWQSWTECTKTCGGGTRQGVRKVERNATNGGVPCTGSTIRTAACNTQSCPGSNDIEINMVYRIN